MIQNGAVNNHIQSDTATVAAKCQIEMTHFAVQLKKTSQKIVIIDFAMLHIELKRAFFSVKLNFTENHRHVCRYALGAALSDFFSELLFEVWMKLPLILLSVFLNLLYLRIFFK